jgi:uncharacterized protein (DUF302 family)
MRTMTADGLIACANRFSPKETANRLAAAVTARGISVMARIDQAAAMVAVDMESRPTEVLLFGNPRARHVYRTLNIRGARSGKSRFNIFDNN